MQVREYSTVEGFFSLLLSEIKLSSNPECLKVPPLKPNPGGPFLTIYKFPIT